MGNDVNSRRRVNWEAPVVALYIYFTDDWSAREFYNDSKMLNDMIDGESSICCIRVEMKGIAYRGEKQSGAYRAM